MVTTPNRNKPYNKLPPIPPKGVELESKPILKACINARTALAELNQAGKLIPNQAVLINTIPLLEAQSSSEIENIVTTTDSLLQLAARRDYANVNPATKEAFRYRTALHEGFLHLKKRPIGTVVAVNLCRTLREAAIDIRNTPGTKIRNMASGRTIYTPPEGENLLREKLSNWERFTNTQKEIDPLVRMAVMHYQFEAIHPFTDGNGRTGRILDILFLVQEGLLDIPVLYLSRYILENKNNYYHLLRRVTERQQWQEWILFMLAAIANTAGWTYRKITAIRELMLQTKHFVRDNYNSIYSHELIDILFSQPYCRIANLIDSDIAKRVTASVYLTRLAKAGVLREHAIGREKLFINTRFLHLLTNNDNDFAPFA